MIYFQELDSVEATHLCYFRSPVSQFLFDITFKYLLYPLSMECYVLVYFLFWSNFQLLEINGYLLYNGTEKLYQLNINVLGLSRLVVQTALA